MPYRTRKKITWREVCSRLGSDLASKLVGLSKNDLEDYLDDKIKAAPSVGYRLDFLLELYRCLSRNYSNQVVKSWFCKKRASLDGQSPQDILSNDWRPLAKLPQKVLKLALDLGPKRKQ